MKGLKWLVFWTQWIEQSGFQAPAVVIVTVWCSWERLFSLTVVILICSHGYPQIVEAT